MQKNGVEMKQLVEDKRVGHVPMKYLMAQNKQSWNKETLGG
jgi:hypothetical protein